MQRTGNWFNIRRMIYPAVTTVMLATLATWFAAHISHSMEDMKVGIANLWFLNTVPTAIATYMARTGSSAELNETAFMERGVQPTTEWGEPWTAYAAKGTVTVLYQVSVPKDAAKIRNDIVAALKQAATDTSIVKNAEVIGNHIKVEYRAG